MRKANLPKFKKGDTVNSSAGTFVVVTGEIVKVEQVYLYTVRGKWPANPPLRFMEHELVKEVPHDDGT